MASVTPLFDPARPQSRQTPWDRQELMRLMDLYGRMVAAGEWRDYALSMEKEEARFAAFRRAADRPEITVVKRPALARKQGIYALMGEHGQVLKRGGDLSALLAPIERRLVKLVEA
jgi:hypothetical protein|tara:strand:- start:172485 stop:172832 length:348 start_codon:yes stop_codon:yes gene_type:complete